jgi:hypothetical protein
MSFGRVVPGDFAQTRAALGRLEANLTQATTDAAALDACRDIIIWGGGNIGPDGAWGHLTEIARKGSLRQYLDRAKQELALHKVPKSVAHPGGSFASITEMNAMLTKVHSLYSGDGLPIYDSRLAGAIATIIETWRQVAGKANEPLPSKLSFKSTPERRLRDDSGGMAPPRRTADARYPGCKAPGAMPAAAAQRAITWSSAKVRLGWLLWEMLVNPSPAGMRALEACLFMAGYDCRAINPEHAALGCRAQQGAPGGAAPDGIPLAA